MSTATSGFRIEKDFLGSVRSPSTPITACRPCGRSRTSPSPVPDIHPALIRRGDRQEGAALANRDTGTGREDRRRHLGAADEVIAAVPRPVPGQSVDPIQGGAGTSINMNTNEVLANRALEILGAPKGTYKAISPNSHVNMAQSTNDAFPTGVHIATLDLLKEMLGELRNLRDAFAAKEKEYEGIIKMGRTHLQDASPSAWARSSGRIEGSWTGTSSGSPASG